MQFTETEEAFLTAQQEVYRTAEVVYDAEALHQAAIEIAEPLCEAIDLPNDRDGFERMYELLVEAGHRAGYADESVVLKPVIEAHAHMVEFMETSGVQ